MKKKLYTLLVLIPVFAACREDKLQDFEDPIGSVYFYIDEKKLMRSCIRLFIPLRIRLS